MDRGAQFIVEMIKKLNQMLGIDTKLLMAYHPQTNKQIEKINQELKQYLRIFIDYYQKQWLDQLATAKFVYNNMVQTSTKVLPLKANNKQDLCIGIKMRKKGRFERVEEFATRIKKMHKEVEAALRRK